MAVQSPIPVHFEQVFPEGAYATGPVEPIMAYDKATGAKLGQAKHPVTGELMWEVPVHDADPGAKGAAKSVKVKIAAPYQPVPPDPIPGHPFAPVEFEQMAITPYVVEVMPGRHKVAYSIQARGITAPATARADGS
jgi:hypothetical protein